MEGEANLPAPPSNLTHPINPESIHLRPSCTSTSTTTTTSSSSSSPPAFLRHVQAAFKRHRPLGMMQSNNIKPRRMLVPQRETLKGSTLNMSPTFNTKKTQDEFSFSQRLRDCASQSKNVVSVIGETPEDASITPPSEWGSTLNTHKEGFKPFDVHTDQCKSFAVRTNNVTAASDVLEPERVLVVEGQKKVHFAAQKNARFQGADDSMATGIDNLLSHMDSLALTEMESDLSNHAEAPTALSQDLQQQSIQNSEVDGSLLARNLRVSDQQHQYRNCLQDDISHPMTQSSVVGTSFVTTTLINPGSAPMLNSATFSSEPHHIGSSNICSEIMGDNDMNIQPMPQREVMQASDTASKSLTGVLKDQASSGARVVISTAESKFEVKKSALPDEKQSSLLNEFDGSQDPSLANDCSAKDSGIDVPSDAPLSEVQSLDVKLDSNKSWKQEKVVGSKATSTSRRKNYDADLFFKVNGKLYQRLGKIGSGGSSEVHKVISSDCKIYALKKIKLKGRDYATAYGFCQEIEYLNKLKGKDNIIQLIDYEVTDKVLLQDVTDGSMNNKDGRVKEDGYIYMVLEYGEIDLAHMLSQKWKALDSSKSTMDENWLRFYWQQILLAVNTIHEERIVHSDLKPANFLLVRGSLKLIDFGIAKAIMSDTTNIQRDSQVGTLSYMSPEAFMCNETDANGNTIKCGRPSDIWSLGCILYQMVYGRTPFSEYKTFWAKFKVITDRNHEITYELLSNPCLLDLMKKCLAWDRNQRWRIPQLLQHPFLVPPIPPQVSAPPDQCCKFLQLIAKSCKNDRTALMLCSQLDQLLRDPRSSIPSEATISLEEQHKVLCDMSNLCLQLANLQKHRNPSG